MNNNTYNNVKMKSYEYINILFMQSKFYLFFLNIAII